MATVAVAGATGNLGGRIVRELLARKANVIALVRAGTPQEKLASLQQAGVKIAQVDLSNRSEVAKATKGAVCLVSSLQGLRDVIIDTQSVLLDAAVSSGVQRFIPSDYSLDYTKLEKGENRNLDLRREFRELLLKAPITSTAILNGGFMDMLVGPMPFLNLKDKKVNYFGNADQKLDFTTMDDIASYTAAVALDPSPPQILRIAGEQFTARELAAVAEEVTHSKFEVVQMNTLEELDAFIKHSRASDPQSENSMLPRWQAMQYVHNMFSGRGKNHPIDNARYPDIKWTGLREFLTGALAKQNK